MDGIALGGYAAVAFGVVSISAMTLKSDGKQNDSTIKA
jgi:hypothetical protein